MTETITAPRKIKLIRIKKANLASRLAFVKNELIVAVAIREEAFKIWYQDPSGENLEILLYVEDKKEKLLDEYGDLQEQAVIA